MQLKSFAEVVALSEQKLDEALAPIRAKAANAAAQSKVAEIEENLVGLEADITKSCAQKDLDLDHICDLVDEYELLERRKTQLEEVIGQLFPSGVTTAS